VRAQEQTVHVGEDEDGNDESDDLTRLILEGSEGEAVWVVDP
jgi:hypothetical protein